jgi:hypothetical protein
MKRAMASVILLTFSVGCHGGSPFKYVPVQGQVTYEDGSLIPARGMRLQFESLDVAPKNGMYPRPATAALDAEGLFTKATSYKYGDGLVPGRHKVAIGYATDKNGKLLVPESCTNLSTTPLIVDTADAPLVIKVPKP